MATNQTLRRRSEVEDAIQSLEGLGLQPHPSTWEKNWDLAKAVAFITDNVDRDAPILDAGARWSPVLERLEKLGYSSLLACDVKRSWRDSLRLMRTRSRVRFSLADLTATPYETSSFGAVTCLSVIEHGVDPTAYVREMSRIIRPGGFLITSTDYWCSPIATSGIFPYGPEFGEMRVFGPQDIEALVDAALDHDFELTEPLDLRCDQPVVHWARVDRRYTFTFFVLRRR